MFLSKFSADGKRVLTFASLAVASTLSAQAVADDGPAFKLTAGYFRLSESGNALDLNVRHSSDYGNAWVGFFRAPGLDANQWRTGWDNSFGSTVRIQPSVQAASGGFVGGSLNVETGKTWVAGAGFGRTNLRPYYNLNFDPNDSWSLMGGYRGESGTSVIASYVRDNRENPDQQHFHVTMRTALPESQRLTFDVLYKRGLVDGARIAKAGATLTYDWPRYFVRLAFDPNTNFTPDNAWRLSVGMRF